VIDPDHGPLGHGRVAGERRPRELRPRGRPRAVEADPPGAGRRRL